MRLLEVVSYPKQNIYWIRDSCGDKISILAIIEKSTRWASKKERSNKLADKAERIAIEEAERVGSVVTSHVSMGGTGRGTVWATGIAEMNWTPDVEQRLVYSGVSQIK